MAVTMIKQSNSVHMLNYTLSSGQSECLQPNNANGLPPFMGYQAPPSRRIQHQHQAIIPTYKFTCCGNITEWGVDLNPVRQGTTFSFDFQVWRPSPTVNDDGSGCYSLVGNYAVSSISIDTLVTADHVARVTPTVQLQYQPGDVLGFYVESQTPSTPDDNGVVVLNDNVYRNEQVWFARLTRTTSLSGSCPYSVGNTGVLDTSSQAAPVISIATSVYACPLSFSVAVSVTPTPILSLSRPRSFSTSSVSPSSMASSHVHGFSTSTQAISAAPSSNSFLESSSRELSTVKPLLSNSTPTEKTLDEMSNNTPLIAGALLA